MCVNNLPKVVYLTATIRERDNGGKRSWNGLSVYWRLEMNEFDRHLSGWPGSGLVVQGARRRCFEHSRQTAQRQVFIFIIFITRAAPAAAAAAAVSCVLYVLLIAASFIVFSDQHLRRTTATITDTDFCVPQFRASNVSVTAHSACAFQVHYCIVLQATVLHSNCTR